MSTADPTPPVLVERSGDRVTVTLDRPARHNALVPELLAPLRDAFSSIATGGATRVAVLRAAGPSFSTGGDIGAMLARQDELVRYADELVGLLNESIAAIAECHVPVVVAVDGQVT